MMRVGLVCVLVALCGCSAPAPEKKDESPDIYEAVFRHQFKNNSSAMQDKATAYFLEFKDNNTVKDPPPEFMKRFEKNTPPVRLGSEFKAGKGLKFLVGDLTRIDASTVEVRGGYYEHGKSSSVNEYRVIRKNGGWVVERDKMLTIS